MHFLKCVHVKDSHGCTCYDVYDDPYDNIMISVNDAEGRKLHYEGEVRHLGVWCEIHGLRHRTQILEIDIPNPFDDE